MDKVKPTKINTGGTPLNIKIVLCYLWLWVSGIAMLISEQRSSTVRFHAWQSVLIFGCITVLLLLLMLVPPVPFGFLYYLLMAIWVTIISVGIYLWVLLLVTAFMGKPYTLPVIGNYAARLNERYPSRIDPEKASRGSSSFTLQQTGSKVCISCGKNIPQTAIFCPECGEKQFKQVLEQINILSQTMGSRQANDDRLINTAIRKTIDATVNAVTMIGETRDPYTAGHQQRVTRLALAIAEQMQLPLEQREGLRVAGQLHDIGKISVPSDILNKPGKLSEGEMLIIKGHSRVSYDILKDIEFPWPVAGIVYQHHERLDGSGYPQGLKGEEILIEARILAVADVVEAMASHRPYRPALGIKAALKEITDHSGSLYDPDVVDSCLKLFNEKGYTI